MILFSVKEAAQELGLSQISVRHKTRLGEIPHKRMGGLIRFTQEDLEDYGSVSKRFPLVKMKPEFPAVDKQADNSVMHKIPL